MEKNSLANNIKTMKALRIFILTALSAILFYPPYLQGLFFEKDQLPTEIFVFSLFIIFLVYKWLKKDFAFLKTPLEFISLGFVAVYFISILAAVHTRSAIEEVLKYCMYFAVFYMVSELAESLQTKMVFLWTIIASAVGVSIIGLDSAMGGTIVNFLNQLFNKLGAEGNLFFGLFVSGRINSTLQYPNALASYVMAVFFLVIGLILSEEKLWIKVLYGACSYLLLLTFMLTKSRGAQLLFPLVAIIFMVVAPKKTRIKSVFYVLFLAIPAIGISIYILPHLSAEEINQKALILFAAGILITVLFTIIAEFLGNLLQRIGWRVYVGLIAVLVVVLPLAVIHVINASVPLELSHGIEEENSYKSISRDVSLAPGEYILQFEAETNSNKEQPHNYYGRTISKTENDIVFGGSTELVTKTFKDKSEARQESIEFSVPEDSALVTIQFTNYYSGTGVILDHVAIIDPISGNTVQKVILKNKYNLDSLISRFQNITQESSGMIRLLFYKDGMKIFKERWLLGGGGGAWEYLYRQYQSYGYQSTQAHNFPLQLGIETGVIGLLVLLGLIFFLVLGYLRYVKKTQDRKLSKLFINTAVITAITALFMHSVIDFDFSESAMLLLFWQLIGLFNREMRDSQAFETGKAEKTKKDYIKSSSIIGIICGVVVCAITLGFSISFYSASLNAKEAFRYIQQRKTEEAIEHINRAIRFDKFNEKYVIGYNPIPVRPDIKAGLVDILFAKADLVQLQVNGGTELSETELNKIQQQYSEMNKMVAKIEQEATNNLTLSANLASFNFKMGNIEKGIEYLNRTIQLSPFEPSLWYSKINLYFELTKSYYNNTDDENAKKYLEEGLSIIQEAMEVNRKNMDPFMFDEKADKILQIMKYMHDYYDQPEMEQINEVIHYTIPNLDINLDQAPDQWRSGDSGLIKVTASEKGLELHAVDRSFIYMLNRLKLEKGKKYVVEVLLDEPVGSLSFLVDGLTNIISLKKNENNLYSVEFLVEKDPSEKGNRFRIFVDTDCIVKMIKVIEKAE